MSLLGDTHAIHIDLLKQIKKKYRTFLLSNTDSIHVGRYRRILENKFSLKNGFSELFEEVYYSHEVGLRKPDPLIFKMALKENGLNANETLHIDGSLQNLGMRIILLKGGNSMENIFGADGKSIYDVVINFE